MRKPRLNMTRGARIVTAGLLFLVLLVGGGNLWATYDQVGNVRAAQVTAARSAASVAELCRTGNDFRAQQVSLWDHILTISANSPPPLHETPAQKRQRIATARAFIAYVHRVFAPRRCPSLLR